MLLYMYFHQQRFTKTLNPLIDMFYYSSNYRLLNRGIFHFYFSRFSRSVILFLVALQLFWDFLPTSIKLHASFSTRIYRTDIFKNKFIIVVYEENRKHFGWLFMQ